MSRNNLSDNEPSTPDHLTQEEIAAHAHQLWLDDGQPEGRAAFHWATAERHLRALMTARSAHRLIGEIPMQAGQERLLS